MTKRADPFQPPNLEPARPAVRLVGVVADDLERVVAYLSLGGVPEYVIIRTAADVPPALGGLANLRTDVLEPELRDALIRALGVDHG